MTTASWTGCCGFCPARFSTAAELEEHQRGHRASAPVSAVTAEGQGFSCNREKEPPLLSPEEGRNAVIEEAIARLERHWKSCMARGDKRGDDMAEGINLAIESIRALAFPVGENKRPEGSEA